MLTNAKSPDTVVSIKVQTTRLTGGGVEDIPLCKANEQATHWSIYLRQADNNLVWVEDIRATEGAVSNAYSTAVVAAAKLSIQHKAFIEVIK